MVLGSLYSVIAAATSLEFKLERIRACLARDQNHKPHKFRRRLPENYSIRQAHTRLACLISTTNRTVYHAKSMRLR